MANTMMHRLKSFFSVRQKQQIKQLIESSQQRFAFVFGASPFLCSVYYLLFSSQFRREHYSVLQGRIAYQRGLSKQLKSSALIRRNIHRLEKGLIMQPRKNVFAEDYIIETVVQLSNCYAGLEQKELRWAFDVISEYFSVVALTPAISLAFKQFQQMLPSLEHLLMDPQSTPSVPYSYQQLPAQAVTYEELLVLFRRRRSVRFYLQQEVPEQLITAAIDAASLAPSACNRQPYKFHRLSGADAVKAAAFAMGTSGFSHQIPYLLVVTGDLSAYPAERDRHVIYIDGALASMQLMLALDTLGLASCPINWPDIESRERQLSDFLQLPAWERPIMLIACGYADPQGGIPFSQKKSALDLSKSYKTSQQG